MRRFSAVASFFIIACQDPTTESVDTTVCASGTRWVGGDEESANMNPGEACIACHSRGEGPSFTLAGTVYDESRQADDCYGSVGATVEITDAKGKVVKLGLVDSGSFYSHESLTMPYTAKVIRDGVESKMLTPQSNGDCNACHTVSGVSGAPGRILAP
ncbi:MAG: hypothetical protein IV100_25130 [Myxococcales bacterium]|nr:hypothetical protein [Myxococcales bacterium]